MVLIWAKTALENSIRISEMLVKRLFFIANRLIYSMPDKGNKNVTVAFVLYGKRKTGTENRTGFKKKYCYE
jgi:hypothetical protein